LIRFSTARRAATLDVALSLLFTCVARFVAAGAVLGRAISRSSLENRKSPRRKHA
jgi:hypothetical protein